MNYNPIIIGALEKKQKISFLVIPTKAGHVVKL